MEINPVSIKKINTRAANVYEAVMVAAQRARHINDEYKQEYKTLIGALPESTLDDDFEERDNSDRLTISLDFEKRPKPHINALNELVEGKVNYRYKDDDEQ